jgi:pyruvate ferredoxin oxidoreductase delta subunit
MIMSKPYWTKENFPTNPVIRNPGGSLAFKSGAWRMQRPVIDHGKCTKCGLCAIFCPDIAIKKLQDGQFEINLDYCKGCGICANECPQKAIQMVLEVQDICTS